jgi:hypothetical protein
MSALSQKRTFCVAEERRYSITSSAATSSVLGTVVFHKASSGAQGDTPPCL